MKIVIDIPEDLYESIKQLKSIIGVLTFEKEERTVIKAIKNGTPLPDNATNGDVLKVMFPNAENIRTDNGLPLNFILEFELHRNYKDWWNAPYKAGDTDG